MLFKVITHSLEDTSLKFKGIFKVSYEERGFANLKIFKGGRNSRKSLNLR